MAIAYVAGLGGLLSSLAFLGMLPLSFAATFILGLPDVLRALFKLNTQIMLRVSSNVFSFGIPCASMVLGAIGFVGSYKWHWAVCAFMAVGVPWVLLKVFLCDADLTGEYARYPGAAGPKH